MTPATTARRLVQGALAMAATATLATTALATTALAGASPAGAAATRPAQRPAAANAVAGYAWVENGTVESYYDFNSKVGNTSAVMAHSSSPGVYQVEFANLGSAALDGVVQITSYGSDLDCVSSGWTNDSGNLLVIVGCYSRTGTLTNGSFDLIVTHPTSPPHGVFDYAINTRANSSGTLTGNSYNSSHKQNTAKHLGTGRYQILFGGPKTTGTQGVVHVTPFTTAPGNCEVVSWTGSAKGELVNVDCFSPGPNPMPQNHAFIVTYATTSSLMGLNSQVVANAFANSTAQLSTPNVQFNSKKGAKVSIARYTTGEYEVLAFGSGGNTAKWGGDVQVNAVGTKDQVCISQGWSQQTNPSLIVNCFDKAGNLADAPFTVEWVVP
jgi:hypothetical protein